VRPAFKNILIANRQPPTFDRRIQIVNCLRARMRQAPKRAQEHCGRIWLFEKRTETLQGYFFCALLLQRSDSFQPTHEVFGDVNRHDFLTCHSLRTGRALDSLI
jgi:hypothetical protein